MEGTPPSTHRVTPAKAGAQTAATRETMVLFVALGSKRKNRLDSGLRRNDDWWEGKRPPPFCKARTGLGTQQKNFVISAKAEIQGYKNRGLFMRPWTPAFAGVTWVRLGVMFSSLQGPNRARSLMRAKPSGTEARARRLRAYINKFRLGERSQAFRRNAPGV